MNGKKIASSQVRAPQSDRSRNCIHASHQPFKDPAVQVSNVSMVVARDGLSMVAGVTFVSQVHVQYPSFSYVRRHVPLCARRTTCTSSRAWRWARIWARPGR